MRYRVRHKTTYQYSATVHQSYHLLHLSPGDIAGQTVYNHRILTVPTPARSTTGVDDFGNPFRILTIESDHDELVVEALSELTVRLSPPGVDVLQGSPPWMSMRGGIGSPKEVQVYAAASRHGRRLPMLAEYARVSFTEQTPILWGAQDLMRRIFEDFTFDAAATDVSTAVETVFKSRRGVCQDFAHLMISALRSLDLPARYVSGYILTHPPPGQPRLQGADASHAWVSLWVPGTGWVDYDPTNNMLARSEHVTLGYGRDYDDISPISGVLLGGGSHSVDVSVDVTPLEEPPVC